VSTGFHWNYGVVEHASSTGVGASPLVGMSVANLGITNPSGSGGAGAPVVTMIPNGSGFMGSEHTVKLSCSYSGNGGSIASVGITASVSGIVANPLFSLVADAMGNAGMDMVTWMDDPNPINTLLGSGGLDAVLANGNKVIDVVASNSQGGLSTTNEFYIVFQELALQGQGGGTTGGGFDIAEFASGTVVTFTILATNTNGQTNQTTSAATMA